MTASVRISAKAARVLVDVLEDRAPRGVPEAGALHELRAALSKSPKKVAAKRLSRQRRESEARVKREATTNIRDSVMARSGGHCECGCGRYFNAVSAPPEMDHFFGRGKVPQSHRNCWALSWTCHREKTQSVGGAARWLMLFAYHCDKHGYAAEAKRARDRLALVEARATTGERP